MDLATLRGGRVAISRGCERNLKRLGLGQPRSLAYPGGTFFWSYEHDLYTFDVTTGVPRRAYCNRTAFSGWLVIG